MDSFKIANYLHGKNDLLSHAASTHRATVWPIGGCCSLTSSQRSLELGNRLFRSNDQCKISFFLPAGRNSSIICHS